MQPQRIESNANVYDFNLDAEDMKALDGLDQGKKGEVSFNPIDDVSFDRLSRGHYLLLTSSDHAYHAACVGLRRPRDNACMYMHRTVIHGGSLGRIVQGATGH